VFSRLLGRVFAEIEGYILAKDVAAQNRRHSAITKAKRNM